MRHLRSLRRMQRDYGWIQTLYAEAENERMHMLCFMQLKQPGLMFRGMVLMVSNQESQILFIFLLNFHFFALGSRCFLEHVFRGLFNRKTKTTKKKKMKTIQFYLESQILPLVCRFS